MTAAAQKILSVPRGPSREELLARIPALVAEIAKGAAQRDLDRELPFEAFRLFREAGLGALRVPVELGGPGGSVPDYIELIAALGSADSNVAHALRSHFNYVENLVLTNADQRDAGAIERAGGQAVWWGAYRAGHGAAG